MKPKIAAAVVIVVMLAAVMYFALARHREFLYAGTVEATEIDLSARLNAVIESVAVAEGARVKQGDELVRLSAEDIRVNAEAAERDFQRAEKLLKAGSMNQEAYDRIRFRRDDTLVRLSWSVITAPSDGTVITRYHEPGEMVLPGTRLLTIADVSRVWAYIYVPQPVLSVISVGEAVEAKVPDSDRGFFPGRIVKINEEAEFTPKNVQTQEERTRLVYGVKVEFDNKDGFLKPGMSVEVRLPERKK